VEQISWKMSNYQLTTVIPCHLQRYLKLTIKCILKNRDSVLDLYSIWCLRCYYPHIHRSCYYFSRSKTKIRRSLEICILYKLIFLFIDDDSKGIVHMSMNYSLKTLKQFIKLDHILLAPLTFSTYASVTFMFAVYTVVS
jgi:hypothetical protein